MKKGIGPRGLGAPKSAAKMYNSPAKKSGPAIGSKKSERLMKKADRLQARASKNTVDSYEYDPREGKVMHGKKYTKKGTRLAKRANTVQLHAMGMSRGDARRATREEFGG